MMKTMVTGITLLIATATTVFIYPALSAGPVTSPTVTPQPPETLRELPDIATAAKIDAVFVLDTTSSMTDLIDTAKDKIWAIASTMASAQQSPEIRIGLVAFRDRGDSYVTQTIDLSDDLDSVYAQLMDFQAQGGGDGPESVNKGLFEAVHNMSWTQHPSAYKTIFLVGDAPPHMNYQNDVKYQTSTQVAVDNGITINTIHCGNNTQTAKHWKRIAKLGNGDYFQVDQSGGAIAVDTPYDQELAALSARLDETRLFYGSETDKARMSDKSRASKKLHNESSVSSRARRSVFNLTDSGRKSNLGSQELVEAVTTGQVSVDTLAEEELPDSLRAISKEERHEKIEQLSLERQTLNQELREIAEKRATYIKETLKPAATVNSLETQLYDAIKRQSRATGLTYDAGPDF